MSARLRVLPPACSVLVVVLPFPQQILLAPPLVLPPACSVLVLALPFRQQIMSAPPLELHPAYLVSVLALQFHQQMLSMPAARSVLIHLLLVPVLPHHKLPVLLEFSVPIGRPQSLQALVPHLVLLPLLCLDLEHLRLLLLLQPPQLQSLDQHSVPLVGPAFPFVSTSLTNSSPQPIFGNSNFPFTAIPGNNNQMDMEDSMTEDSVHASSPAVAFSQPSVSPSPGGFGFGSTPYQFQFGSQQNTAAQNPSPFAASGSFGGGGSFSLGSNDPEKSGRKIVKVNRNKNRRK
ncbi:hypothetical protein P3S68_024782 [Capsicum galapagoense]